MTRLLALLVAVSAALILKRRRATRSRCEISVPLSPPEKVLVTVNGNDFSVDPWLVPIQKRKPIPWELVHSGLSDVRWQLRSKNGWEWPFDHGITPFPRIPVPGNTPIRPGTVTGDKGGHYQYTILITHEDGELEIDPDIFIC